MTEPELREFIATVITHVLSVEIAGREGRREDRQKYLDEIRRTLSEALAE
jgi:hypothetical protein